MTSGGPPMSASLRLSLAAHLLSHQIQDAATSWALPQPGRYHILGASTSSQPPDSQKGFHTHLTGRRGGCIVVVSDARLGVPRERFPAPAPNFQLAISLHFLI